MWLLQSFVPADEEHMSYWIWGVTRKRWENELNEFVVVCMPASYISIGWHRQRWPNTAKVVLTVSSLFANNARWPSKVRIVPCMYTCHTFFCEQLMVPCGRPRLNQEPSVRCFGGGKSTLWVPKFSVQVSSAYLTPRRRDGTEERASWVKVGWPAGRHHWWPTQGQTVETRSQNDAGIIHARHCNTYTQRTLTPINLLKCVVASILPFSRRIHEAGS